VLWPIAVAVIALCLVMVALIVAVFRRPESADALVRVLRASADPLGRIAPWGTRGYGKAGGAEPSRTNVQP